MQLLQRAVGAAAMTLLVGVVGTYLSQGEAPAQDAGKGPAALPRHILIIRHAEKTEDKEDVHLAPRGVNRARVLHRLFEKSPDRPEPFPTPDYVFAASHHKDSQRPVDTVTPFAKKLKLAI